MATFADLGIGENICKALAELDITESTPIQEESIPALLKGNTDFLGSAQTGTGKTAAFGLPLLQLIDTHNHYPQALILCPTRELGQQTAKQLGLFSKHLTGVCIRAVYGGTDIDHQLKEMRKPTQILVATPGRLMDLLRRDAIDLSSLKYMVLDEADEMLNMGFKEDIDYIRGQIYHSYNTWMFCATMRGEIRRLVDQYLHHNHVKALVNPENELNTDIEHQYMVCKLDQKREGLKFFLRSNPGKFGIVFCRTKAGAMELTDHLADNGFLVDELHGSLKQQARDKVMKRFKNNELQVLVATDIAARGLDITGLHFVVHFHLPTKREYFAHRSGRTGRAGNKGISLCIVFQKEVKKIVAIANNLGLKFTKIEFTQQDILDQVPGDAELPVAEPAPAKLQLPVAESAADMVTFYINIGKVNDVNHRNLVEFICAETELQKKDIGKVTVEKKRSYFEIHQSCIRKLIKGLDNLYVDGKQLVLTRTEFE